MAHTNKKIESLERVALTLPSSLRREISLWRHANLIPSEMEAMRQLMRRALDDEAKKGKTR